LVFLQKSLFQKVYFKKFLFWEFSLSGRSRAILKATFLRHPRQRHAMSMPYDDQVLLGVDGVDLLGAAGLDRLNGVSERDTCFDLAALDDMATVADQPEPEPEPMASPVLTPFARTPIFSDGVAFAPGEVVRVLRSAFGSVLDENTCRIDATVEEVLGMLQKQTNYEVVEVVRIDNYATREMQRVFQRVHGISADFKQVYHGTSKANAAKIEKQGFRAFRSMRNKYGDGVYTTSSVWEALGYADLDGDERFQRFFVASLLLGNKRIFDKAESERSVDDEGRPLHTTTDPLGKIFCAWYESQLDLTHLVTVRWVRERPLTVEIYNRICIFQPDLWKLIGPARFSATAAVTAQTAAVTAQTAAVTAQTAGAQNAGTPAAPATVVHAKPDPKCHYGFVVGDVVKLNNIKPKWKQAFNGKRAVIRRMAYKNERVVFYVEVVDEAAAVVKAKQNSTAQPVPGPMEPSWLQCWYSEVSWVVGSVLGKRK
jgi:hypothetical protein